MNFLFAADIHVHPNHLSSLVQKALALRPKVLIIGGDVIPHQLPRHSDLGIIASQAEYIRKNLIPELSYLKSQIDIDIYLDMGNDDLVANRALLQLHSGHTFQLLHMQHHRLTEDVDIMGYMIVPPTPFQRKDWEKPDAKDWPYAAGNRVQTKGYITTRGHKEQIVLDLTTQETIEKDLNFLSAQVHRPFIFVSHSPPYGTPLDRIAGGGHVGSISIRRFIEHWSRQGLLIASLHGHIHESPRISGQDHLWIHDTLCFNPGQRSEKLQFLALKLNKSQENDKIKIIRS